MFQSCLKLLEGEREEICFRAVLNYYKERERERGDLFQGCLKLLEGEREEICFRAVLNY